MYYVYCVVCGIDHTHDDVTMHCCKVVRIPVITMPTSRTSTLERPTAQPKHWCLRPVVRRSLPNL